MVSESTSSPERAIAVRRLRFHRCNTSCTRASSLVPPCRHPWTKIQAVLGWLGREATGEVAGLFTCLSRAAIWCMVTTFCMPAEPDTPRGRFDLEFMPQPWACSRQGMGLGAVLWGPCGSHLESFWDVEPDLTVSRPVEFCIHERFCHFLDCDRGLVRVMIWLPFIPVSRRFHALLFSFDLIPVFRTRFASFSSRCFCLVSSLFRCWCFASLTVGLGSGGQKGDSRGATAV